MVLDILQIGDPVLREKCSPVKKFDKELWKLLDDMKETLKKAEGAGLAAPQVGVPLRAVAVDVEEGYFELINPIFVWSRGLPLRAGEGGRRHPPVQGQGHLSGQKRGQILSCCAGFLRPRRLP